MLHSNRGQPQDDHELVLDAGSVDLDQDAVGRLLRQVRQREPQAFGAVDDETALVRLGVLRRADNGVGVTLAGLLTLGQWPQQYLPQLCVTFIAVPGTHKDAVPEGAPRFTDNATIRGPLPQMIEETVRVILRNTRTAGYVRGLGRDDVGDYPVEALREAVTNALAHRDYSPMARGTQIQVELYVDRLVVRNPGGLFGRAGEVRRGAVKPAETHLGRVREQGPRRPGSSQACPPIGHAAGKLDVARCRRGARKAPDQTQQESGRRESNSRSQPGNLVGDRPRTCADVRRCWSDATSLAAAVRRSPPRHHLIGHVAGTTCSACGLRATRFSHPAGLVMSTHPRRRGGLRTGWASGQRQKRALAPYPCVVHNRQVQVRFTQSARRHRIGRARALYVISTVEPVVVEGDDDISERLLWIGPDDRGLELEVIAIRETEYLLVIHVMPHLFRRRTP